MKKTAQDKESDQRLYRLPEDAPEWKRTLHVRSLRLGRLIELNAPDEIIKGELINMVGCVFRSVDISVENE